MRVLMIYCHPREDSLAAALRDAAKAALEGAGHQVELRDLYAEGFRAELSREEFAQFRDGSGHLPGCEEHVEALRRADALLLVHPTWWYGMPAMLKGWFDRIWAPGVAFKLGEGAIEPLLTTIRKIGVVTTYGSPSWLLWYIGRIDRKLVGRGIARLCAKDCKVEWHTLTRMDHRSRAECEAFVAKVRAKLARW